MMKPVIIGAPPVRSLSANEKAVYNLLRQGMNPKEISQKLGIPRGSQYDCQTNTFDVPAETVVNLIISIREKGWDIPTITNNTNKEEENMPSAKTTPEQKRKMVQLYQDGMKVNEIAEKFGISKSGCFSFIAEWKKSGEAAFEPETEKEPASVAADTDSESDTLETVSDEIIAPVAENVKSEIPEVVAFSVMNAISDKIDESKRINDDIAKLEEKLETIRNKIADLRYMQEECYSEAYDLHYWLMQNSLDYRFVCELSNNKEE